MKRSFELKREQVLKRLKTSPAEKPNGTKLELSQGGRLQNPHTPKPMNLTARNWTSPYTQRGGRKEKSLKYKKGIIKCTTLR